MTEEMQLPPNHKIRWRVSWFLNIAGQNNSQPFQLGENGWLLFTSTAARR